MTEHEAKVHLWTRCGGARIDTHEMDCEIAPDPDRTFNGPCCTGNCRQGRDCPYAEPTRAVDIFYWIVGIALGLALVFVLFQSPELLGMAG